MLGSKKAQPAGKSRSIWGKRVCTKSTQCLEQLPWDVTSSLIKNPTTKPKITKNPPPNHCKTKKQKKKTKPTERKTARNRALEQNLTTLQLFLVLEHYEGSVLNSAHSRVLLLGLISWNIWKQINSSRCNMEFLVSNKRQKEVAVHKSCFFPLNRGVFGNKKNKMNPSLWPVNRKESWRDSEWKCSLRKDSFALSFWAPGFQIWSPIVGANNSLCVWPCVIPSTSAKPATPSWVNIPAFIPEWALGSLGLQSKAIFVVFQAVQKIETLCCLHFPFFRISSLWGTLRVFIKLTHRCWMETLGSEGTDFTWKSRRKEYLMMDNHC